MKFQQLYIILFTLLALIGQFEDLNLSLKQIWSILMYTDKIYFLCLALNGLSACVENFYRPTDGQREI